MRFAIIAAGDGSRLAAEGSELPKPLVSLDGVPMIERLIRLFMACGAERVSVIVNPLQSETVRFMRNLRKCLPLDLVVKSTPSPMHSLLELAPFIEGEQFCATTVDTVFGKKSLAGLLKQMRTGYADGVMGVTPLVDDEKPLYVDVDSQMHIHAFLDSRESCRYVSAGVYCLPPEALDILASAVGDGERRMRHFQRRMLEYGMKLDAYDMGRVIDVDHTGDIEKARCLINSGI
ncbi:MAG: NTP transferase domain-containing protein [Bacteroidaceae bacterium]|nr:NTP transferase domain-containing protein [Bacteroidaceae bacterium]